MISRLALPVIDEHVTAHLSAVLKAYFYQNNVKSYLLIFSQSKKAKTVDIFLLSKLFILTPMEKLVYLINISAWFLILYAIFESFPTKQTLFFFVAEDSKKMV